MAAPARHEDYLVTKSAPPPLPGTLYTSGAIRPQPQPSSSDAGIFQEAAVTLTRIKAALMGEAGSGKTTTAFCIALGLSKMFHGGAPIYMHDTENGSDFLAPIAQMEGVRLIAGKSRSFRHMTMGLHLAQKEGACVYIEDSVTSDWNELMEAFKRERQISRLELYHWGEIKPRWNDEWIVPMLNANVHVITCGREGDKWDDVVQEDGTTKATRVGAKMKAEGEFGYEPYLLLQMRAVQAVPVEGPRDPDKPIKVRKKKNGSFFHMCTVLKDKTRTIQGLEFEWPDVNNYKKGDWEKVFAKIAPHVAFFKIKAEQPPVAIVDGRGDVAVFGNDLQSDWHRRKQDREIFIEEIEGVLLGLWPGATAKEKKFKLDTMEAIFGTRSWKYIELKTSLGDLEVGLVRLRNMRAKTKNTPLDDEETVKAVLAEALKFQPAAQMAEESGIGIGEAEVVPGAQT